MADERMLRALCQELVNRYMTRYPVAERHGGCGWCGGLPHSDLCLVGRMETALAEHTVQPVLFTKEEQHDLADAIDVYIPAKDRELWRPLQAKLRGLTVQHKSTVANPCCLDCGLPYSEFPLDVILPRAQWLTIHPEEHGLLCAACIVSRASAVPGVTCVHAILEIAPQRARLEIAMGDK